MSNMSQYNKRKLNTFDEPERPDNADDSQDASEEDNDVLTSSPSSFTLNSSFKRLRNEPTTPETGTDSDLTTMPVEAPLPLPVSGEFPFKINSAPVGRAVRIYCDGIYDLFHIGHAKSLEQAKRSFPNVYLLVGVCDDAVTHKKKGLTVLNDKERAESVRHCKWVDEVIEHAPWVVDQEFLDRHQIDYVAHDDIHYASGDDEDVYAFAKRAGKFLPTRRTDGISTSDIITRIVRDYDAYVRRNLERGVSRKELNVGFLRNQQINMTKSVSDIRESIIQNWQGTAEELKQTFAMWDERSHELVRGFAGLFGAEAVVKLFRRRSQNGVEDNKDSETSGSVSEEAASSDEHPRSVSPVRRVIDFIRRDSAP